MRPLSRCLQDAKRLFQGGNFKHSREPRGLQHPQKKRRRIHELHLDSIASRPAPQQQQGTQTSSIELIDFGEIDYQHAEMIERLDPATKFIEGLPSHQASRAAHDGNAVLGFDLISQLHNVIHTQPAWDKFPIDAQGLDAQTH